MEPEFIQVHTEVIRYLDEIRETKEQLHKQYKEYIEKNKESKVFGLDSFYYQSRLYDLETKHLNEQYMFINNRIYCDYYKLYGMVKLFYKDSFKLEPRKRTYPVYKDLESLKTYDIEETVSLNVDISEMIKKIYHCIQKNEEDVQSQNKNPYLNIDNYIYNHNYNNAVLKKKNELYEKYLHSYHIYHMSFLSHLRDRILLLFRQTKNRVMLGNAEAWVDERVIPVYPNEPPSKYVESESKESKTIENILLESSPLASSPLVNSVSMKNSLIPLPPLQLPEDLKNLDKPVPLIPAVVLTMSPDILPSGLPTVIPVLPEVIPEVIPAVLPEVIPGLPTVIPVLPEVIPEVIPAVLPEVIPGLPTVIPVLPEVIPEVIPETLSEVISKMVSEIQAVVIHEIPAVVLQESVEDSLKESVEESVEDSLKESVEESVEDSLEELVQEAEVSTVFEESKETEPLLEPVHVVPTDIPKKKKKKKN
jgi:hypothetical protein